MRRSLLAILALVLVGGSLSFEPGNTRAAPIAGEAFQRTWQRTDQPVAAGAVNRTWMWGPEPFSDALQEAYEQAPGGQRQVQYFDKSR
ncbi:MAG TPA: hypothetical protein VKZ96_07605, partial [Thermomicrobiales bacterium]|nr:hypothetical protein [Thermomicrobiales bacterium]